MARYDYIGWFTLDPFDSHESPYTKEGRVRADSKHEAYDKAYDILKPPSGGQEQIMNWYVREVETIG